MPASYVRLSAGRQQMSETMQALCFLAGANSIFYGEKLLTTGNPEWERDQAPVRQARPECSVECRTVSLPGCPATGGVEGGSCCVAPPAGRAQGIRVTMDGRAVVSFCSNDYLGLAADPALVRAVSRRLDRWVWARGGASDYRPPSLPSRLRRPSPRFVGKPAALLFSTGYMAISRC